MSKITLENGITVTGATLLTVVEAERVPESTLGIDRPWWLRSPGYYTNCAANVYNDYIDGDGCNVGCETYGVRPVLNVSLDASGLSVGDKFTFGDKEFDVISKNKALCTDIIGNCAFRKDKNLDDANNYELSDVKMFVDKWYGKCLEMEHERAIPTESKEDIEEIELD